MQYVNSVRPRPSSVTVICVLGIIYACCSLLLAFLGLVTLHIGIFIHNGLMGVGFLLACIWMLEVKRSGKKLYHIMSCIWLPVEILSKANTPQFGAFLVFCFIPFGIMLAFNILLCSDQIKDIWVES